MELISARDRKNQLWDKQNRAILKAYERACIADQRHVANHILIHNPHLEAEFNDVWWQLKKEAQKTQREVKLGMWLAVGVVVIMGLFYLALGGLL